MPYKKPDEPGVLFSGKDKDKGKKKKKEKKQGDEASANDLGEPKAM